MTTLPLASLADLDEPPVVVRREVAQDAPRGRLLLLHGLGNSSSVWRACVPHLPDGFEVWSADMPWRGEGVASWHHTPDVTRWLGEALERIPGGVDVVVAHSFAAITTLSYLDGELNRGADPFARYGIRGLVLVSPFYRRSPQDFTWDAMTRYLEEFHLIMEEGIRVHSGGRLAEDVQRDMARRVCDRVGPYGWMRFVDGYLRTPWLRADMIDVPTAVVCGERDFAVSPEEGRALAADMPLAGVRVLPDCGHFLMVERARDFAGVVAEFVETVCPRAVSRSVGSQDR